jgi:hypothetical protein
MTRLLMESGHARSTTSEIDFNTAEFHKDSEAITALPRLALIQKWFEGGENGFIFSSNGIRYIFVLEVSSDNAVAACNYKTATLLTETNTHSVRWGKWSCTPAECGIEKMAESGSILMTWLPANTGEMRDSCAQEVADCGSEANVDAGRSDAIEELIRSLPAHEILLQWARENPPPQDWFDEDYDLL